MLHKLKENLPVIEILLGLSIFTVFIFQNSLTSAILSLIFFIYLWLFTSIMVGKYRLKNFIHLISFSGILVSISLFFILGVEELPYPENAIIFHTEGITKSLFIFFVSTVPLIVINRAKGLPQERTLSQSQKSESSNLEVYDNEKWEEADMEDLESGNFEVI